jgi:hypothetical protein
MSRRSNIFALAAVSAIALAPSIASAVPAHGNVNAIAHVSGNAAPHIAFKSGPIGGNPNTWSPKKGPIGGNPISWTPNKGLIGGNPISWNPHKGPNGGCTGPIGCNPNTWTPQGHWHPHQLPYFVAPVVTTEFVAQPVQTIVSAPVQRTADTCSCLTKDYLPDGSVMFKDLCTKEAAVASPEDARAQGQGVANQTR